MKEDVSCVDNISAEELQTTGDSGIDTVSVYCTCIAKHGKCNMKKFCRHVEISNSMSCIRKDI